ncbi:MAG: hybrid sensor histidine kinase/response regulator, partial [Bradyrhizobium sp.]
IMPGAMNGRQLAEAAVMHDRILGIAGREERFQAAPLLLGRLDAGVLLLAKPYRKPELARMIRIALDA